MKCFIYEVEIPKKKKRKCIFFMLAEQGLNESLNKVASSFHVEIQQSIQRICKNIDAQGA